MEEMAGIPESEILSNSAFCNVNGNDMLDIIDVHFSIVFPQVKVLKCVNFTSSIETRMSKWRPISFRATGMFSKTNWLKHFRNVGCPRVTDR